MISDLDAARACAALYAPQPGDFDHVEETAGVCWALRRYPDLDLLVFRGSMTKEDWFRDVLAELPVTTNGAWYPAGFEEGLNEARQAIVPLVSPSKAIIVAGHSLGAARAAIFAGMAGWRFPVARLILFGCPRPGTTDLPRQLSGVPIASYRNRQDPVTMVPTDPPWSHVAPFIELDAPPDPADISIFRDHHLPLYIAGLEALEGQQ